MSCRLICKLCHLILTHAILLTTLSSLFSSYIILSQAPVSSYFHPTHHPIYNSYHDSSTLAYIVTYLLTFLLPIYNYVMLFLSICPIFSLSKPMALFLELYLDNIIIATINSQWHGDNKHKICLGSCPIENTVNTNPYYTVWNYCCHESWLFTMTPTPTFDQRTNQVVSNQSGANFQVFKQRSPWKIPIR